MSGQDASFQKLITASVTGAAQTFDLTSPNQSTEIVQIVGTWVGTMVLEGSNDNSTYYILMAANRSSGLLAATITANDTFELNSNGWQFVRLRASAWTSGTATVSVYGSDAASLISTVSQIRGGTDGTIIGNTGNALNVVGNVISTIATTVFNSESPDPSRTPTGASIPLQTNQNGQLETHSTILTDKGTFRDDFTGTSLYTTLTGTVNFTNGSKTVTGTGTLFTTEVKRGQFLRKSGDTPSEANYQLVVSVESDTSLTIEYVYPNSTQSTTAIISNWLDYNGTTIAVANSFLTMSSGTAAGFYRMEREATYPSYRMVFSCSVSQRIANQTVRVGFIGDADADNPYTQAAVIFDGTNNKIVKLRTASSNNAYDTQDITVTLTGSLDTSQALKYELDTTKDSVVLLINGRVVAQSYTHLPGPYASLEMAVDITNSTTVTNTDVALDYFFAASTHRLEIKNTFLGSPLPAQMYGTSTTTGLPTPLNLDINGNLIVAPTEAGVVPTLGTKLFYDDMNAGNNGIARSTSIVAGAGWTQIWSYTGTGLLLALKSTFEDLSGTPTNYWSIRVVIDGNEIFGSNGISGYDISLNGLYNWNTGTTPSPTWAGLNIVQDTFSWDAPEQLPITFKVGVQMYIKRTGTVNKLWKAGLACLVKST